MALPPMTISAPLPSEGAGEHVRNALQILRSIDPQKMPSREVIECLAAIDARLGIANDRLRILRGILLQLSLQLTPKLAARVIVEL